MVSKWTNYSKEFLLKKIEDLEIQNALLKEKADIKLKKLEKNKHCKCCSVFNHPPYIP